LGIPKTNIRRLHGFSDTARAAKKSVEVRGNGSKRRIFIYLAGFPVID
jgi:hypothetical protein